MTQARHGKFITVEGTEGVGKSTNLAFISHQLEKAGISYITTREPGGTELAELIRTLLISHHDEPMCEMTELLLIFAARAQHIDRVIAPAMAQGKWVLCDRFTDATFAYQGGGRGLDQKLIEQLQDLVQESLRPDLTIILDLAPEVGLKRAQKRADLDRFEVEKIDFFNKVRQNYLSRAALEPERCKVINADATLEQVQADIERALGVLL
ncbi:MAG: dTMP kinase [Pseudohongiellaceae bacterium]|nr:dTMP kinase [Pseudohongiellaceae bacterium]